MRLFCTCITVVFTVSAAALEPENDRVSKHFKSANYTATWNEARRYDASAELEIGEGDGHAATFGWLRFQPADGAVGVLSVRLDEERKQYFSKWPPDLAPVKVTSAAMKLERYAELLRDLAVVDAADLKPVEGLLFPAGWHDFWISARVATGKESLLDVEWVGPAGERNEIHYAKPRAAYTLAVNAIAGLKLEDHALTDEERRWASAKFVRDWKNYEKRDRLPYWWVRERYLVTIGVVGDASALPTLRDILGKDSEDRHDREHYYTINAVTRLTGKDVRPTPVEEMDVEATRRKVLKLLPGAG